MDYIIRKADIDYMKGLDKTHFLNANAQRVNKSLGDRVGLQHIGFHVIEVQPGHESTEYHVHHAEEECAYVLEGVATVTIDGQDHEVGAGDFIGYPAAGLPHTMKNTGNSVLRCIVVGQRLSNEVVDYPNLGKRLFRHGEIVNMVDVKEVSSPAVGQKK